MHKHLFLLSFLASLGSAAAAAPRLAAAAAPPLTILVTHPLPSVLHYYATLVREHVLDGDTIRIVGIYHTDETEDYSASAALLQRENLSYMSLRPVRCPLSADAIFKTDNPCRDEFRNLVQHADGIIFNGGPDIPPSLYGRPTLLTTIIETPHRHYFELALLSNLLGTARNRAIVPLLSSRTHFAIMAICVGMQSLNVADGGTLIQDIPSEVYGLHTVEEIKQADPATWHRSIVSALDPEPGVGVGVFHPIVVTAQAPSALRMLTHSSVQVLSIHHQAVGAVGADYMVTATSLDGKIIEGIRHKSYANVMGWQFHPERPYLWAKGEIQRQSQDANDTNFAFTVLQKDTQSRAFHLAVWQVFANALRDSAKNP